MRTLQARVVGVAFSRKESWCVHFSEGAGSHCSRAFFPWDPRSRLTPLLQLLLTCYPSITCAQTPRKTCQHGLGDGIQTACSLYPGSQHCVLLMKWQDVLQLELVTDRSCSMTQECGPPAASEHECHDLVCFGKLKKESSQECHAESVEQGRGWDVADSLCWWTRLWEERWC